MQKYESERPDAVFLNVTLPDRGGMEVLKRILELNPAARVTMITGHGARDLVEQAKEAGAVGFILKPFSNTRLLPPTCSPEATSLR